MAVRLVPTLDIHGNQLKAGYRVRMRNGAYQGYWGTIESTNNQQVTIKVPPIGDGPGATITLSRISVELVSCR